MRDSFVSSIPFPEFSSTWSSRPKRSLRKFNLEVTARCNNHCRHCYINLPDGDREAKEKELSLNAIEKIADESVFLGALWCLITGGEPLLREDFFELYLCLKKKGLLVSVFTNATLITDAHVKLFKKYPPRDIEISVYGITQETYERVTRNPGSFSAFIRGLNLLVENGINVRLKAMALRSNVHEMKEISNFCREKTTDYFRFDPFLHLRFDGNPDRNEEIREERLVPSAIVALEQSDLERFELLKENCDTLVFPELSGTFCNHLFHCGAGNSSFTLSYDGLFRLCSSLWHPDCLYDLKAGSLLDAWCNFVPVVRNMRSENKAFLKKCRICRLPNLCMWCPAHSFLETRKMDSTVDYFCRVAHERSEMLKRA